MDVLGVLRRGIGLVGVVLIYLGVSSEEEVSGVMNNVEVLAGAVLYLVDFGRSLFKKLVPPSVE